MHFFYAAPECFEFLSLLWILLLFVTLDRVIDAELFVINHPEICNYQHLWAVATQHAQAVNVIFASSSRQAVYVFSDKVNIFLIARDKGDLGHSICVSQCLHAHLIAEFYYLMWKIVYFYTNMKRSFCLSLSFPFMAAGWDSWTIQPWHPCQWCEMRLQIKLHFQTITAYRAIFSYLISSSSLIGFLPFVPIPVKVWIDFLKTDYGNSNEHYAYEFHPAECLKQW